jgi:thiaminase/transcriptional activator TenA
MGFSDRLLAAGSALWEAQFNHPFITELADGTLDEDAFRHWIEQDYLYLLDYARLFAIAGVKASDETTMTTLLGVAHVTLETEMDLHRSFAEEYGISAEELATVQKAPTCIAYTSYLLRTAYEGSYPEVCAALYPCSQCYLDVGNHAAALATTEHKYTPWIELYTSDEFHAVVTDLRAIVDEVGQAYPGYHDAMEEAFLTSARLEYAFWDMAYTQETWEVGG